MQKDKFIELTDDMMMKLSALVDPKTGNVGIGRMYEGFDYLSIAENEIESDVKRLMRGIMAEYRADEDRERSDLAAELDTSVSAGGNVIHVTLKDSEGNVQYYQTPYHLDTAYEVPKVEVRPEFRKYGGSLLDAERDETPFEAFRRQTNRMMASASESLRPESDDDDSKDWIISRAGAAAQLTERFRGLLAASGLPDTVKADISLPDPETAPEEGMSAISRLDITFSDPFGNCAHYRASMERTLEDDKTERVSVHPHIQRLSLSQPEVSHREAPKEAWEGMADFYHQLGENVRLTSGRKTPSLDSEAFGRQFAKAVSDLSDTVEFVRSAR